MKRMINTLLFFSIDLLGKTTQMSIPFESHSLLR